MINSTCLRQLKHIKLNATGDFACGDGTLTGTGRLQSQVGGTHRWAPEWTATFENGVGLLGGTATQTRPDTGETRDISGWIVIDDGAATGACDDSARAQDVRVLFVLT